MNQVIDGKSMYVVDFDTMPEMPITGLTETEATAELAYEMAKGLRPEVAKLNIMRKTGRYAAALNDAIKTGIITEPGKYGIYLVPGTDRYEIAKIIEP